MIPWFLSLLRPPGIYHIGVEAERRLQLIDRVVRRYAASAKIDLHLDKFLKAIKDEFEDLQQSSNERAERKGETPSYTDEMVKRDIKTWQDLAKEGFKALADNVEDAARSLPNWGGSKLTLVPMLGIAGTSGSGPIDWGDGDGDPKVRVSAEVFVHKGGYQGEPSFTVFGDESGKIHGIDDVLDAGDPDFFRDPETQADYFQLTEELRNPGRARQQGNKVVTLYTARPQRDRNTFDDAKSIPVNVFLTTNENEALGYQRDMESRDVYYVRIKRMYLVETLNQGSLKNYQTFNGQGNTVPVVECRVLYEGETSKTASHYTPAENVAINLMVQSPDSTVDELVQQVKNFSMDLYDEVTGEQVKSVDVLAALDKYAPHPIHGSDTRVYHATDAATAKTLMRRGLIPETKPRPTSDDFEYAPGRGIDVGLYVGASPREVLSYGRVVLEVVVPKKFLEVPTEQAQLGVTDPMQALRQHDGAIINHRLPPDAFRIVPEDLVMKMASVAARKIWADWTSENVPQAMAVVTRAIQSDEGYLYGWHDNLAMAAYDEGVDIDRSNRIAQRFLRQLFDVDSKVPQERTAADRVAAKYQEIKKVPKANGKGTTEVYVYSEKQVENRNREKAKRLQEFSGKVNKLRAKYKKDLSSEDETIKLIALVIALIDETHERIGSPASAKGELNDDGEPHFGVSQWLKKHVTMGSGKATIKYVGKSGVDHEKEVTTGFILKALRWAVDRAEGKESRLFEGVTSAKVNEYLKEFNVTAKDLRGLAANGLMQKALKKVRKGELPKDKKEREKQLKSEFKEALEEVAEQLGHEASTLKSQYLAPKMQEEFEKDGTVISKLSG